MKQKKKIYIEIIRILAILCVIFNHTNGFALYASQKLPSPQFVVYTAISVCCKVAVPLFMMISGGLLLAKDEQISKVWKNRIIKFIVLTVIVSAIYYIHNGIMYKLSMNFEDFIKKLYSGAVNGHLWYLYMFIAYLISLPLLRKFVHSMDTKCFVYMFGVAIFFIGILPTVEYLVFDRMYIMNNNMRVAWIVPNVILYPCMGYFVENQVNKKDIKRVLPWVWMLNVIGIGLSVYMTYKNMIVNPKGNIQEWLSVYVAINAICIYMTIKWLLDVKELNKIVVWLSCSLGECTFGIYLIHIIIKDRPYMKELLAKMLSKGYNLMLTYIAFSLIVFAFSYVVVFILKKIPGIKKMI